MAGAHRSWTPPLALKRRTVVVTAAVALVVLPWVLGNPLRINVASDVAAYSVAILGLNLIMGYCGQVSLGHSAFVGIGAYTTMILVATHGWPYLATLPASALVAFAFGVMIGLPALRIRGLYLAALTLAVAMVFPLFVMRFGWLTGGSAGIQARHELRPPSWTGLDPKSAFGVATYHYLVIATSAVVMFLLARNAIQSRFGRAVIALRDGELSAAASGVRVAAYKVMTFGLGAAYGAVAGSLLMIRLPQATPTRFGLDFSILLVVALVIGGLGSVWSSIAGGAAFVFVRSFIPNFSNSLGLFEGRDGGGNVAGVIAGVLLLVFVFRLPGGLYDGVRRGLAAVTSRLDTARGRGQRPQLSADQPTNPLAGVVPASSDSTGDTL